MHEMPEELSTALHNYTVALGALCIALVVYTLVAIVIVKIDKRRKKKEDNIVEKPKN